MSEDDLTKIGVTELGLRRAILHEIEKFVEFKKVEKCFQNKPTCLVRQQSARPRIASAPPDVESEGISVAMPREITARGLHSECVVCQDAESTILFLNCGHVCTCQKCSEVLHECPLDRSEIVQKIRLVAPLDNLTFDAGYDAVSQL
jgi:E3 ubiquitin-protein ligase LRSAM1